MFVGKHFSGLPVAFKLITERGDISQHVLVDNSGEYVVNGVKSNLEVASAVNLIHAVATYFRDAPETIEACEKLTAKQDTWTLTITNDEDDDYQFVGCFGDALLVGQNNLSDLIREIIDQDVWAFDGNTQDIMIDNVVLTFYQEDSPEWDELYTEKIRLTRQPETINYHKITPSGAQVTQQVSFKKKQQVTQALSYLEQSKVLQKIHSDETHHKWWADKNEHERQHVKLDITYMDGSSANLTCAGHLWVNPKHFPDNFPEFTQEVSRLLINSTGGEVLDAFKDYKIRPTRYDYIFCSVEFSSADKSYYYLTDDESIEIGDEVVVPVGLSNALKVVTVVDIEYFDEKHLPMPINKVKNIVQKIDVTKTSTLQY